MLGGLEIISLSFLAPKIYQKALCLSVVMLRLHVHLAWRRCPSAPVVPSGGSGEALSWVTFREKILPKITEEFLLCEVLAGMGE